MTGRTHDLVAASAALGVGSLAHLHGVELGALVGGAYLTARLPDADMTLGIPHRGLTHWVSTCALVVLAAVLVCHMVAPAWTMVAGGAVAVGLLSHLLLDACTRAGIPAFGPFSTKPRHLLPYGFRFLTGGLAERIFFWGLAFTVGSIALYSLAWRARDGERAMVTPKITQVKHQGPSPHAPKAKL